MRLTRRHAELFLSGKRLALTLINAELADLQKDTREFETKKAKVQQEIKVLEGIVKQREQEVPEFRNISGEPRH
jgi:hypothetical protein